MAAAASGEQILNKTSATRTEISPGLRETFGQPSHYLSKRDAVYRPG
jgi:hypothetical protein